MHLGRGSDLSYDTSTCGFAPISIILLIADAHREQSHEEQARVLATNTTVADYKKSKKYVLILDLTCKRMRIFLKCWKYSNLQWMTKYSLQTRAVEMLENMFIKRYMLVGWVEPEALLSILWTVFCDARMLVGRALQKQIYLILEVFDQEYSQLGD